MQAAASGGRSLILIFLLGCAELLASQTASPHSSSGTVQERLGYPAGARLLIIHADDLGMDHSVNRATLEALEKGWITSASILVPCPWFPEAARWAAKHPQADLGIHLALTSEWTDFRWGPISGPSEVPSLLDKNGYFPLDTDVVVGNAKMEEAEHELRAQIERARAFGVALTHFDMHMAGMVASPELFGLYRKLRDQYGLPVLLEVQGTHAAPASATVAPAEITLQRVITMEPGVEAKDWLDWYKKQLSPLPPGVYQLIVHLAYDDEEMRGATWDHPDWGAAWRQRDFDMVRSPEFRRFLKEQGFILITWRELGKALQKQ